jgi:exodeoxyribonuclease V beta subunit
MPRYDKFNKNKNSEKIAEYFEQYITDYSDKVNLFPESFKSYADLATENSLILKKLDLDTSTPDEQNKILAQIKKDKKKLSGYKHSYSTLSHGHDDSSFEDEEFILDKEGSESVGLAKFDKKALPIEGKYDSNLEAISLPNDYPKGSLLGNALHEVFEDSDFTNYDSNLSNLIAYKFINQGLEAKDSFISATKEMVGRVLNADLPEINGNQKTGNYFKLSSIEDKDKLAESEFLFNFVNEKLVNYLNGFVDLIFKRGEYYSILDWKSDKLNDEDFESFTSLEDIKKHVDNSYSIQRVLYSYCLINWLKNFYKELTLEEIFNKHFGGIYYVFLRGCNEDTSNGVYAQTWSSYQDIEDAFNEIIKDRLGGKH